MLNRSDESYISALRLRYCVLEGQKERLGQHAKVWNDCVQQSLAYTLRTQANVILITARNVSAPVVHNNRRQVAPPLARHAYLPSNFAAQAAFDREKE